MVVSGGESSPYEWVGGNLLVFVDPGSGPELWRMRPDGRRPRAVWKPPLPLHPYGELAFKATIGPVAVFTFNDGAGVRQVWAADGTSPGPGAGDMVAFRNRLHFLATGSNGKTGLWRSDGTTAGTVLIKDDWFGQSGERAMSLGVVGDRLAFAVNLPHAQIQWRSDGTAEGTAHVPGESFQRWSVSPALDLDGVAVFQASRSSPAIQWWRGDETGVRPVRDGVTWQHLYPSYFGSRRHAVSGGRLFYSGIEEYDAELWVTDGTSEGSRRVKDLNPGPLESNPHEMLAVGDLVYFAAHTEEFGVELWSSDGTEAGTELVADVETGPASSWPQQLKAMDGKLYFHAMRRDIGRELFVVDLPPAP